MALETISLRRELPRTWYAFFSRFEERLRPVQVAAIPDLVAGRDALLMAPTASGKTEAAAAPLIERLLSRGPAPAPGLLWLSPTRALANDLWRRLEGPCAELGIGVARRTGDHPSAMKRKTLPELVITTPESLDSLLCRVPASLGGVRGLVLDELHLLLGSGRGDQLAVLVSRLRRVTAGSLQTVVLSATLEDPEAVGRRFLDDPVCHRLGGARSMEVEHLPVGESLARGLSQVVRRSDLRKVLAFVDRRATAESLTAELRGRTPFGDAVLAHHGSLERRVRESVEERFLSAPRALCVATSTLEVGIDIGDVDAVLLLEPPASVSSLLQRVGRGNRRSGVCRVLVADCGAGGRLWFDHLMRRARAGDLCEDPIPFRPGALAQQAVSLMFQNRAGWVSAATLHGRLPPDVRADTDLADIEAVLAGLVEEGRDRAGWLEPGGGSRYVPGERALEAFERGSLHSVIDGQASGVEVVDELTGATLGKVARGRAGERLGLGGRRWQVVREGERELRVRGEARDPNGAGVATAFPPGARASCSRRVCTSFAAMLDLPAGTLVVLPDSRTGGREGWDLFHFMGTAVSEVLAAAVTDATGTKTSRPGALAFTWHGKEPSVLGASERLPPGLEALERATIARAGTLARRFGCGPFSPLLPRPLVERFALSAIDLPSVARSLTRWEVRTDIDPELARALGELRGR